MIGLRVRGSGAAVVAALVLAGCSAEAFVPPGPTQSTSSEAPAPTSPTPPAPATTTSTSSTVTTAPASPTSTGVLPPSATGRPLSLTEFFRPDDAWSENRFDIASQSQVQGIGVTVQGCGDNYAQVLELRLSNSFDSLAFSAAQANDSISSTSNLQVEVTANNRQVDIQRVPFNEVRPFVVPVTGVNAVQIRLSIAAEGNRCPQGTVVGVVTGVTLA